MAKFDVYSIEGSKDLFLELQANRLQGLVTKIGAPLVLKTAGDRPIPKLQPELVVSGKTYVMLTEHLFSVPAADLKNKLTTLIESDYRITSALDLLFGGT